MLLECRERKCLMDLLLIMAMELEPSRKKYFEMTFFVIQCCEIYINKFKTQASWKLRMQVVLNEKYKKG